jgi:hypothetical protein
MNKDTCFDADMNYKSCSMAQRSPDAIPQTSALHLRKVALVTRLNLRKLGSTSFVHGQHYAMRSRRYRILGEKTGPDMGTEPPKLEIPHTNRLNPSLVASLDLLKVLVCGR